MLKSACIIDNTFIEDGMKMVSPVAYCLEKLEYTLIDDLVKDTIINEIKEVLEFFPEVDLAIALVEVGVDLHDAIRLAYDYNLCCASHTN